VNVIDAFLQLFFSSVLKTDIPFAAQQLNPSERWPLRKLRVARHLLSLLSVCGAVAL